MERFRFVSVSFPFRFRSVFVDKKKNKNAATTVPYKMIEPMKFHRHHGNVSVQKWPQVCN